MIGALHLLRELAWRLLAILLAYCAPLTDWLLRVAKRNPYFDLPGYMQRWWLLPAPPKLDEDENHAFPGEWPRLTRFAHARGKAARFHLILRGDNERHGHDHPWAFRSLVLRGWYVEESFDAAGNVIGERLVTAGMVNVKRIGEIHRIRAVSRGGVLTLVIHDLPTGHGWGFNKDGTMVPWRQYLSENSQ